MNINSKLLDKISFFYVLVPLFIFLIGFLNMPFAILSCVALLVILKFYFGTLKSRALMIDKSLIVWAIILSALWCYYFGIGGFVFQNEDWHMRNAIFRDLINFSYPVFYNNGSALVYYIAMFLPGALVGKIFSIFGVSQELAFTAGNVFNYLYCTLGLLLVFLQVILYIKANKLKHIWVFLILIFFSGLDIAYPYNDSNFLWHIEWHGSLQYSSNTTLLYWVYNQAIIPWLIIIMFLKRYNDVRNFGIYGTLMFFSAPFPFLGFAVYLIGIATYNFIIRLKTKYLIRYLKRVFSLQNIVSVFLILPIFYLFYSSSDTVNSNSILFLWQHLLSINYYLFLIMEVGLYLLILKQKYSNNIMFYITLLLLLLLPLFRLGSQLDLTMRASIPALFILMILIIKFLLDKIQALTFKIILICLLCVGMVTPLREIARTFYYLKVLPKEFLVRDDIKTLNGKITSDAKWELLTKQSLLFTTVGNYKNYGTYHPEDKIFFKYIAKKIK